MSTEVSFCPVQWKENQNMIDLGIFAEWMGLVGKMALD